MDTGTWVSDERWKLAERVCRSRNFQRSPACRRVSSTLRHPAWEFSPLSLGRCLAQVRHETAGTLANPFRISSGGSGVGTTFGRDFQALRQGEAELMKERFLFLGRLGDPAEADLAPVRGGQHNVGALECG